MKRQLIALLLVGLGAGFYVVPLHADSLNTVYAEMPAVVRCDPGALEEGEKEAVLVALNRIRRLHNLTPVSYAGEYDREVMEASLVIAANNQITHTPAPDSVCYSEAGAVGAASSNLAWSFPIDATDTPLLAPSATDLRNWLIDPDVPGLGHRRWLLNPFLQRTAYGRVEGAPLGGDVDQYAHGAVLKVSGEGVTAAPQTAPAFVAYPYGDYPLDLFEIGWYWSFSVVVNARDYWANDAVDFSHANVRVRSALNEHRVHSLAFDDEAIGLPNFLQWKVDDVELGELYQVEISGVLVRGEPRTFTYTTRLVPPDLSELDMPTHAIDRLGEAIEIRAGAEFALYAPPPARIPNQYTISRRGIAVQMADHSPYVRILRVTGSLGDEVILPFAQGTVTLRIAESADGVRNPLLALRQELGVPVYKLSTTGATFTALPSSRFALYVSPLLAEAGVRRVEWTNPPTMQLSVDFYNSRVLIVEIAAGVPGDEATVLFGADHMFVVQVGESRSN